MGLLLALVLALAMAVPALAVEFTDIEDHDYEASIQSLATRGFIGGYDDGTFRPDNPLQRQQFAKMAVLTMDFEVTADDVSSFPDTPAPYDPVNNPLYPGSYVAVAAANNLIQGYTNGSFGFYDNVTRQQVISVVVRAAGDALAVAPDDYEGELDYSNPFHGANIKKAEYNGLLAGISDLETWDLTANATRGEAAELLAQLFNRTGKILKITGPVDTIKLSLAELEAMDTVEGYGGWKNNAGVVTGPFQWKGVAITDLLELVGGGAGFTAIATDGFEAVFTADELNGVVTVFDPTTGEEITDYTGTITVILAYESDGSYLPPDDGVLRVALVSEEPDQVTRGNRWAKLVAELVATE
jgi:hypothetical protein